MTLDEYIDGLKNKTVAVVGIGVSNTPLLRLLAQSGGTARTACPGDRLLCPERSGDDPDPHGAAGAAEARDAPRRAVGDGRGAGGDPPDRGGGP